VALGGSDLEADTLQLSYSRSEASPVIADCAKAAEERDWAEVCQTRRMSERLVCHWPPEMARRRTPAAARPEAQLGSALFARNPFEPLAFGSDGGCAPWPGSTLSRSVQPRPGGLATPPSAPRIRGRSVRPHDPANSVSPESSRPFVRSSRQTEPRCARRVQDL